MQADWSIYIVGTTAVGKTKLSLALASLLQSQIVGCDSMQLYKHADVMTAKATLQQRQEAKHHMVDMLQLTDSGYNRNKFYESANKTMQELWAKGKTPIIVGGTNYYLETLLFEVDTVKQPALEPTPQQSIRISEVLSKSLQDKYRLLQEIDKQLSEKIHPNDQHRLDAYLKKYIITGQKPSLNYGRPTEQLRNPNTILFWIRNSNRDELRKIMKERIDSMLNKEGIVEILSVFGSIPQDIKIEGGVLQSIGYKQFQGLVKQVGMKIPNNLTTYQEIKSYVEVEYDKVNWLQHKQQLQKCKQALLISTMQYAKRQVTWIRNRLFASSTNNSHFFVLELSGKGPLMQRFENQVRKVAVDIIHTIKDKGFGSIEGGLAEGERKQLDKKKVSKGVGEWKKHYCNCCKKYLSGDLELKQHVRTTKHKKAQKIQEKDKKKGTNCEQKGQIPPNQQLPEEQEVDEEGAEEQSSDQGVWV